MRPRVFAMGAPFELRHSSNSTRRPRCFDWTDDPGGATVPITVCLDAALFAGIGRPGRKLAWLAESPAISVWQGITAALKNRLDEVMDAYELLLTCDRSLCLLHPRIVYHPPGSNLPWLPESDWGLLEKSERCSMFASGKRMVRGHELRHEVADRLKDRLDLFGGACGSRRLGGSEAHPDKSQGLLPYRFHVAMENCRTDLYYTEKLTDCFATGTVPVYWGSRAVTELFDGDGILWLDDDFDPGSLSPELYESMLPAVRNNLALVRELPSADDELFRRYLRDA